MSRTEYIDGLLLWRVRPLLTAGGSAVAVALAVAFAGMGGMAAVLLCFYAALAALVSYSHYSCEYVAFGEDGVAPTERFLRWQDAHRKMTMWPGQARMARA